MSSTWHPADTALALPPRPSGDVARLAREREQTPAQVRSREGERTLRTRLGGNLPSPGPAPLTIVLTDAQQALCVRYAKDAEVGGRSNIHKGNQAERLARIAVDQQVGQLATLAMLVWQLGPQRAEAEYVAEREVRNADATAGDGGSDIQGGNEDAKGTLHRYANMPLLAHNLLVRPGELHEATVYVFGLVEPDMRTVNLIGWATDSEIRTRDLHDKERFGDAFMLPAVELHPLPPFRWGQEEAAACAS